MIKIPFKNIRRWFKKHKLNISLFVLILLFPFVVALILKIPFLMRIDLKISDCLVFYGASLGIFSTFLTYQYKKKKEHEERQLEIKPIVSVQLQKNNENLFQITIYNHSKSRLSYLYLYDEFVSEEFKNKQSLIVTYLNPSATSGYNITMDYDIMDIDGYPKYIQILCEDIDKNTWDLCFYKTPNGNNTYHYYLRDIEQIQL